jgi:hypothetical protein
MSEYPIPTELPKGYPVVYELPKFCMFCGNKYYTNMEAFNNHLYKDGYVVMTKHCTKRQCFMTKSVGVKHYIYVPFETYSQLYKEGKIVNGEGNSYNKNKKMEEKFEKEMKDKLEDEENDVSAWFCQVM